ncbi:type II secretion system F family protein [Undibacterium arcticum]
MARAKNAIVGQIIELGGTPVNFQLMKPRSRLFSKITGAYKEQFLRAIYFNCSAMSAAKALEAVIESDTSSVRTQLNPALAIIKRGGSFMEAIEALNAFDESTLAILEAGERTGTLSEAINTAVEHLQSSATTAKLMIGMGTFAAIEVFMAVSSLLGNRYGMLPSMTKNIPEKPRA